jgi:Zn-finger nucleic acid-binding protein
MDDTIDESAVLRKPGPLLCPKCRAPMTPVTFEAVVVDRCTTCGGLWFDLLEHEDLKAVPGAEAIDTGNPEVGARYDQVGRIRCPVDDAPMIRMVDKGQPSLWVESCPLCYGVFFDAGEFSEFREENLSRLLIRHRRHRPL